MKKLLFASALCVVATAGVAGDRAVSEVRAVGEPRNCVQLRSIRSTDIIDNRTIDFRMVGGKTYRNSLPHSCPGLKFEDRFSYRTSTSQLCNVDIVRVLHDYGGRLSEGAGCGLGKFQPVEKISAR